MPGALLPSRLPLTPDKWRKEGRIMTRGQPRTTPADGASGRYGRPSRKPRGHDTLSELLSRLPVRESVYSLSGVSTAVLEGGEGPPIIFLDGPGEYGAKWI